MNFYNLKVKLHKLKKKIFPIRGRNTIQSKKADKYRVIYDIIGNYNSIDFGKSILNNVSVYVRGCNNILIVEDDCYLKNTNFVFEGNNCSVKIGEGTTSEGVHFDVKESKAEIIIGRNCMFSDEIFISTSDSHSILNSEKVRTNPDKSVFIHSNVWIGKRAMILKGSYINSDTIVAAGSIVSGNLKSNSIYAGNPAKLIKENIKWIRERV